MTKAYLVNAIFSGFREETVGVCPTAELASLLSNEVRSLWDLDDCEISSDKFDEMAAAVSWSGQGIEPFLEHYPEYSVSDIERAVKYYTTCPFLGCITREVDQYVSYDDIKNYGTDD